MSGDELERTLARDFAEEMASQAGDEELISRVVARATDALTGSAAEPGDGGSPRDTGPMREVPTGGGVNPAEALRSAGSPSPTTAGSPSPTTAAPMRGHAGGAMAAPATQHGPAILLLLGVAAGVALLTAVGGGLAYVGYRWLADPAPVAVDETMTPLALSDEEVAHVPSPQSDRAEAIAATADDAGFATVAASGTGDGEAAEADAVVDGTDDDAHDPGGGSHLGPAALLRMGNEARSQGHHRDAASLYRRLQGQFPNSREATVSHHALGRIYLDHLGAPGRARRQFDRYLRRDENGVLAPEAILGKALCFAALGDPDGERLAWEALLRRYPSSPQAVTARTRLRALGER